MKRLSSSSIGIGCGSFERNTEFMWLRSSRSGKFFWLMLIDLPVIMYFSVPLWLYLSSRDNTSSNSTNSLRLRQAVNDESSWCWLATVPYSPKMGSITSWKNRLLPVPCFSPNMSNAVCILAPGCWSG